MLQRTLGSDAGNFPKMQNDMILSLALLPSDPSSRRKIPEETNHGFVPSQDDRNHQPHSDSLKWKINVFHWFLFASVIDIFSGNCGVQTGSVKRANVCMVSCWLLNKPSTDSERIESRRRGEEMQELGDSVLTKWNKFPPTDIDPGGIGFSYNYGCFYFLRSPVGRAQPVDREDKNNSYIRHLFFSFVWFCTLAELLFNAEKALIRVAAGTNSSIHTCSVKFIENVFAPLWGRPGYLSPLSMVVN